MADRNEIIAFCDELLDPGSFDDYGPNGLQVPGSERVDVVVTGVTAQLELFDRAAEAGAQLVICHHGLFWDFMPRTVDEVMKRRLRALFGHERLEERVASGLCAPGVGGSGHRAAAYPQGTL